MYGDSDNIDTSDSKFTWNDNIENIYKKPKSDCISHGFLRISKLIKQYSPF